MYNFFVVIPIQPSVSFGIYPPTVDFIYKTNKLPITMNNTKRKPQDLFFIDAKVKINIYNSMLLHIHTNYI